MLQSHRPATRQWHVISKINIQVVAASVATTPAQHPAARKAELVIVIKLQAPLRHSVHCWTLSVMCPITSVRATCELKWTGWFASWWACGTYDTAEAAERTPCMLNDHTETPQTSFCLDKSRTLVYPPNPATGALIWNIWFGNQSAVQGWSHRQSHWVLTSTKQNSIIGFAVNFIETVNNSVNRMDANAELVSHFYAESISPAGKCKWNQWHGGQGRLDFSDNAVSRIICYETEHPYL